MHERNGWVGMVDGQAGHGQGAEMDGGTPWGDLPPGSVAGAVMDGQLMGVPVHRWAIVG